MAGYDSVLPQIKVLRAEEGKHVSAAQVAQPTADASPNPDGHLIVAAHYKLAAQAALQQWGMAHQYCDLGGKPDNYSVQGCHDMLDPPLGDWGGIGSSPPGAGKRSKERAWWYNEWARLNEIAAEKKGAPPPAPKIPPVAIQQPSKFGGGAAVQVQLPPGAVASPGGGVVSENPPSFDPATGGPIQRDPNAFLVDPVTGAVIDPSTGQPAVEEPSLLETNVGRVGILAAGAGLLYLLYRFYRA